MLSTITVVKSQNIPINGQFLTSQDNRGHIVVYFKGFNACQFAIKAEITCVNKITKERVSYELKSLAPGQAFTIGPENNWYWQPGERIYITVGTNTAYWIFNPQTRIETTTNRTTCARCLGSGNERCLRCSGSGTTALGESCSSCYGTGEKSCAYCAGLGYN